MQENGKLIIETGKQIISLTMPQVEALKSFLATLPEQQSEV
jgi:hypothetical protein